MFRTGDRVVYTSDKRYDYDRVQDGDTGTVIDLDSKYKFSSDVYCVNWDRDIGGHTCGGKCEPGHGWSVLSRHLKLLNDGPDIDQEAFLRLLTG